MPWSPVINWQTLALGVGVGFSPGRDPTRHPGKVNPSFTSSSGEWRAGEVSHKSASSGQLPVQAGRTESLPMSMVMLESESKNMRCLGAGPNHSQWAPMWCRNPREKDRNASQSNYPQNNNGIKLLMGIMNMINFIPQMLHKLGKTWRKLCLFPNTSHSLAQQVTSWLLKKLWTRTYGIIWYR